MSRDKQGFSENSGFIRRFVEVCATDKPAKVQQLLNISYQAARNYLSGRLPDTKHLMIIAEKTPFSIHWLLTGRGKKFVNPSLNEDTPLPTHQFNELVRQVTVEVMNEINGRRDAARPKIVTLHSSDVYSEKATEDLITPPESRPGRLGRTAEDPD